MKRGLSPHHEATLDSDLKPCFRLGMEQTAYQRAIAACGSPAEFAKRMGVSAQLVNYWRLQGIPAHRALKVSEVTGIPVEDILKAAAA